MLHYIYSRSFINVITFMVLALAAWGAMPAFVGARRWRCGNLALMLLMTVLSWVNSATASISFFSFSGSTLAVSSSRMMMGASFMTARAMDMVKDSFLNGIWLNVAEPVLTEQQRFALRFQRQQDLFSLLRGGEVEICRWLVKEKKYLCPWPMPREWRCAVARRWTAHKRCGPSAVPDGHKKRTDGPSESTFRIYCKVSHNCRQPALVKSRTACKQVSILLSSMCRSSS